MKILGIITARGGSKGIPGKNIKLLLGKPLIAYTIDAAKASGAFDPAVGGASRLILSTDDEEIAKVAKSYGIEVPFMRPKELAEDKTPHLPVIQHAVSWLRDHEQYKPDAVMILQPTAPLRQHSHIKETIELFIKSGADSVVSVSELPSKFHPKWQFVLAANSQLNIFTGEPFPQIVTRRQDLPKTYTRNGAIYLFKPELLFKNPPSFYGGIVRGYVMKEEDSVNIDSMDDWQKAENHLKNTDLWL